MKLGICEWVLPVKGPALFEKLKSLGIDGIQLDDWDGFSQMQPMTDPVVQQLYKDASEKTGVELIGMAGNSLGREGGMIHPLTTPQGQQCWKTYTSSLDACKDMGLPVYLAPAFFAGFPRTQADRRNIVARMADACRYAAGSSVTVALESIFPAEQLNRIWEELAMPNFGIYYDTQNPVTYAGIPVAEDIRAIGPGKIVQIHVKDGNCSVQGSEHLGCGETDFFGAVRAIGDIGYDGWIVLENYYSRPVFHSRWKDPWDRIAQDVEIAKKAFHMM